MALMEMGDLSADSYPFGGYNTIVDSLYLGKPIVTWEGRRFVNRASSHLLRRVGLGELVATTAAQYADKIINLVSDYAYRQEIAGRIAATDLKARIFDSQEPAFFKKAIDFLIANHSPLAAEASRAPIFIK